MDQKFTHKKDTFKNLYIIKTAVHTHIHTLHKYIKIHQAGNQIYKVVITEVDLWVPKKWKSGFEYLGMKFTFEKHKFLGQFEFHNKTKRNVQRFPLCSCPYTDRASPFKNLPCKSGAFITFDEPVLIHHNHLKANSLYLGSLLV